MLEPMDGASEHCSTRHLLCCFPAGASSETESEAGDIMDQQFEEGEQQAQLCH